jgi:hypothetical protein
MGNSKNGVKPAVQEWEVEDTEPLEEEFRDRILILRKGPIPRKVQLIAAGVKDIRCVCCVRIKPIASAEELGDGWVCEDCLSDAANNLRYGGQREK